MTPPVWRGAAGAATLAPPDNIQGVFDMQRVTMTAMAVLAAFSMAGSAGAASDPVGDFLAIFTGAHNANLDFTSAEARFDGTNFNLKLTLDGAVGAPAGQLYVWGINRGAGTARLNDVSDPDLDPTVKWDSLAVLTADGTLRVVVLPPAGPPAVTPFAGGAVIDGNTVTASVPFSLLTSRGFAPTSYTFQLWSRLRANPAVDGPNTEIADFGPRIFAGVPEPASWAMMIGGFALAGMAARRRRSLAVA